MIKVNNLTKYFDNKLVLDDVSFHVKKWSVCGFIWENGAGKSTTMRILSTLILDYSGEIKINDMELRENIEKIRPMIWFMPDQYGLYDDLTVLEYLNFFALSYGLNENETNIEKILEQVDLLKQKNDPIKGLSRGMTQRICLAKALVHNPPLLILDEPASWLDPKLRIKLKNLLLDLKKQGKTIFVSSHILSELWDYCDEIIIISEGKIAWQNTLENLSKTENPIITIRTDNNKKALEELWKMKNIKNIEEKETSIVLNIGSEDTNEILKKLIAKKIKITYFSSNRNLEEIYIDILK